MEKILKIFFHLMVCVNYFCVINFNQINELITFIHTYRQVTVYLYIRNNITAYVCIIYHLVITIHYYIFRLPLKIMDYG